MAAMTHKVILGMMLGVALILLAIPGAVAAARTFHVQETEFVKVQPEAIDADQDPIVYSYSPPLNQNGEWQTDYGDAGQYHINITASDGVQETVEQIRIIVVRKNQGPYLLQNKITVNEGDVVDLIALVKDPDDDPLQFEFKTPFDRNGKWQTGYDDESNSLVTFTAQDQEFKVLLRLQVTVLHSNMPPAITDSFSEDSTFTVRENAEFEYWVTAEDEEPLSFSWSLDGTVIGTSRQGSHQFNFDAAGSHTLLVTASDGVIETSRDWTITVENVNRRPELNLLPLTASEGERVTMTFPTQDLDNDPLTYSFDQKFDANGTWQTTYDDAGTYTIAVEASDGDLKTTQKVRVTVLDVDRAPQLQLPEKVEVQETSTISWSIDASDPDGDEVTFTFSGLPEGARFDDRDQTIEWQPGYDTIRRSGGMISNLLNTLRIERFLLRTKTFPVTVTACGKELCTAKTTKIRVYNVNRAPVLGSIAPVTLTENEKLVLKAHADDPDGDIVHYYFTSPIGKRSGEWQTDTADQGSYVAYVTATDGIVGDTIPVNITVLNKNQEPTVTINYDEVTVNERQEFTLQVDAIDPDGDNVTLVLEDLPPGASFADGIFVWNPPYDTVASTANGWWNKLISRYAYLNKKFSSEKAVVWLRFTASDAEFDAVHLVKVTVKNVNQKPEILDYLPQPRLSVQRNEPVLFHVAVKDGDNDAVTYRWEFSPGEDRISGSDTVRRTFITPGVKYVKVIVSDGRQAIERNWEVVVSAEDFNPPQPAPVKPSEPPKFKVYVIRG